MDYYAAPAKLNLFLHVVGRRDDGYHELETFFQLLDFSDRIGISANQSGVLRRVDNNDELPQEDLSIKAARLLKAHTNCTLGADIDLVKRIPLGSGLGGGSSDAATTLIALNRLWGLGLGKPQLGQLARQLGADVPVFVGGRSAWAGGTGDELIPATVPPAWYCVVVPKVVVSTALVFADPTLTRDTPRTKIPGLLPEDGKNDLEPVTCVRYPQVGACLEWLRTFGDARMSGSGSALFLAVDDEQVGLDILAAKPAGTEGFVARGIVKHPLFGESA